MDNYGRRDFFLGLVFFGGIALLLYYTIVLTGFSFQEKSYLNAWFPNASGLKEGDMVLVSGRQTGSVKGVSFYDEKPDDRRIRVSMEFDNPVTLPRGYRIRISEFTILGGRVVEIDPGPTAAPRIPPDSEFLGSVGFSAIAALGELVAENRDAVEEIIENFRSVSEDLAQGKGALGAMLVDPELRLNLEEFMSAASQVAEDIRSGKGAIGMLVEDQEARVELLAMINDGADAMRNLVLIATQIASGQGALGSMLTDESMQADTLQLVSDLSFAAERLKRMMVDANQGVGLLGKLISDEKLASDAADFLAQLSKLSKAVVQGEGTVGKLLTKNEAYDEMMSALKLLNYSLEDVREAQPVSSFAGMLLGTSF